MITTWDSAAEGVLELPSGRLVRGRGLRDPLPEGPVPDFGLYLLGQAPKPVAWESTWLRWRDFWLPDDRESMVDALRDVFVRSETSRVELACKGGIGRTGTALACLAILDGVPSHEAVAYVRKRYRVRAVENPWQHRFVKCFQL